MISLLALLPLTQTLSRLPWCSPAEQDKGTAGDGQNGHDQGQTLEIQMEQWDQPGHDEPDAQQDHPQVLWQSESTHFVTLLLLIFLDQDKPPR